MESGCTMRRSRAIGRVVLGSNRRSGRSPSGRDSPISLRSRAPQPLSPSRPDRQRQSHGDCRSTPSLTELSPAAAIALHEVVGLFGALATRLIDLQPLAAGVLPGVEEGLHRPPAGL